MNSQTVEERLSILEEKVESLEKVIEKVPISNFKLTDNKKKSPKEFLLERNPKDDLQRTLYLAYYLEKYEGAESFGVDELREVFHSARVPIPTNLNDKVNKNIGKGYLMDTNSPKKGKKAWILTATGELYVETSGKSKE